MKKKSSNELEQQTEQNSAPVAEERVEDLRDAPLEQSEPPIEIQPVSDGQPSEAEPEMQQVRLGLNCRTGGLTYTSLVIAYCIFSLLISAACSLIAKFVVMPKHGFEDIKQAIDYIQGLDVFVYVSYLISPIMISLCVLIMSRIGKIKFSEITPVKCKPKYFIIGVMLIFGLMFSLIYVNKYSIDFFKLFGYKPREQSSYMPDLSGGKVVLALIVIAVLPALFEEVAFRGLLLGCTENGMGSIGAILLTGFCFSLFHGSPEQTVYQFIAGCAFALIAVRSRSLLPSIMMHFINNATIVILSACHLYDEAGNLIMSKAAFIVIIILSALSFIGALVWLILDKTELKKREKGSAKEFFMYASVGVAVLGLIWIMSLFGAV